MCLLHQRWRRSDANGLKKITAMFAKPVNPALGVVSIETAPMVRIGGMNVLALSRSAWAEALVGTATRTQRPGERPYFFTSANGNVLSRYAGSKAFRDLVDQADAIDADGMPMVYVSRWLTKTPIPERCATTDFFHDVAAAATDRDVSFYLLGGTEEINAAAAAKVQMRYPNLRIAGHRNGYFDAKDEAAVVAAINRANPDILWVGLGVPHEHAFVVRNRAALTGVGVIKTCGGLFDFLAGKSVRAPAWMQAMALEWAYRLYLEPRRLLWRYAKTNAHALWLLATRTSDVDPSMRMPSHDRQPLRY
jgi:N-acetylglucosaminyldiphosphoundecaprenol N-acetyl-beta-D-mannosaminyltransferase